jgi:ATP-dependent helicase/DNAse subunit B
MQEMRLLLGPPGSGKTTRLLEDVRRHLREGLADFRYLTPTATMRDHLTNSLARDGLMVRTSAVTTLAGFMQEFAPGVNIASPDELRYLTGQVLEQLRLPALEPLRASPGLANALAGAMDELASAGCDPGQWAALGSLRVWDGDLLRAFGVVYEEVDKALRARGLARRAGLLAEAARRIAQEGTPGLKDVYVDGFFTFSAFELNLLEALARRTRLHVALPEWTGAREAVERLRRAGLRLERLTSRRSQAASVFCPAPNAAREVEEVALRILEARGEGLAWRDCGVILRGRETYVPLLETTFARFGIPWRSYFASPLLQHSAARCLAGLLDACLAGWEHDRTLSALAEPACRASSTPSFGTFVRAVREDLPGEGLDALIRFAGPDLLPMLETLVAWQGGDGMPRPPAEWAASIAALVPMLRPPSPGEAEAPRGPALQAFLGCTRETARLLESEPLTLAHFRAELAPALQSATLRDPGRRRDAVHLLDAFEARQWELPVVIVCGLNEGVFPRRPASDPILPGALRLRLRTQGIPIALPSEREQEERFVFQFAQTRATRVTHYTWPELDANGDPLLRSFALDLIPAPAATARRISVRSSARVPPLPSAALDDHRIHDQLRAKFAVHRTTALESFLQCPFQFYLRYTAELQGEPDSPSERLNPLLNGIVLHEALKNWHQGGGAMDLIFDSIWTRALSRQRIPRGHAAEFQRSVLRRSLLEYARISQPDPAWSIFTEQSFEIELSGCRIKGRIDRYDLNEAGEARVFDYKFSSGASLINRQKKQEEGLSLQGGLYLLALQRQGHSPVGFHYVGLKNEVSQRGWDGPEEVASMMEGTRASAEAAAFRIFQGSIEVAPQNQDACQWCEFGDACRVQTIEAAEIAEAAG